MRASRVLRCAAGAGWHSIPRRACDYPELENVKLWRDRKSEAPQPIVVLTGKDGLANLAGICKSMPTDGAGCVGIELPEREVDSAWLDEQAALVVKAINVLYCPWVHVVCNSVGALLAMRVAHRYSDRVGTITVIDTPLVNNASMRESELVQALRHSETDPNVTDQEIEALEKELASLTVAESVKTPVEADADTFGALLNPEFYPLTYQLHLEKVGQPMMVVRSQDKANPVIQNSDIACYYNTFNVKTILPVDGSDRKSLYTTHHEKVAEEIQSFHNRYRVQHQIESQWEETKAKRLSSASEMGKKGGGGDKGGEEKGGGKKKKKKNK